MKRAVRGLYRKLQRPALQRSHRQRRILLRTFKSSAGSEFYGRVGANMEGAAPGTFRLAVANEGWGRSSSIEFPLDLSLNTDYRVVLRYSLATDGATLWVNPLDESSLSVSGTDGVSYAAGGLINPFGLRQGTTGGNGDEGAPGEIFVDDLIVGGSFLTVVPEPSAVALTGLGLAFLAILRRRK